MSMPTTFDDGSFLTRVMLDKCPYKVKVAQFAPVRLSFQLELTVCIYSVDRREISQFYKLREHL